MVRIPTRPPGPPRHCEPLGSVRELANRVGVPLESIPEELLEIVVYANPRLRRAFGRARRVKATGLRWIELFPGILGVRDQYRDTLGHEIAHHCAGFEAGHGPEWKRWARRLGVVPKSCGSTEQAARVGLPSATPEARAERAQRRRLIYVCSECEHEIRRARPFLPGRTYRHRGCGGIFRPR